MDYLKCYFEPTFTKKRDLYLLLMVKEALRALAIWLRPDSLELLWFWPGLRATILPFLVTFNLLLYDLFVFI